uniref:Cell death inducing DFFA like effector c n=1 Tax=Varanus komodoensis TaxID=61221 RepID=A0A8D2KWI4_VARKO
MQRAKKGAKKSKGLEQRCVSASASVTQQLLASPAPPARPFRVSNCDRTLRKGIMADSLKDLALSIAGNFSLVLDEDSTVVETEDFFQTLEEGTVLLVLTKGQTWRPAKVSGYQFALSHKPRRRIDVACVTFDLYKTNPRDFIGCLNVKATLYGTYSMSYDMQCHGAKKIMKEALRWTLFTMQATGHVLLGTSCYVQQLLNAAEKSEEEDDSPSLRHLLPPPSRSMLE